MRADAPPRTVLIVCPVSVMANWMIQINRHVNGRVKNKYLTTAKYHGPKRDDVIRLVQYNQIDVLITSYHTLAYDLKKLEAESDPAQKKSKSQKKRKSTNGNDLSIFDVAFHRIVLDEAHIIRSSKTGFFKACELLQAKHKLCLTGTPLVNRPSDLQSLLSFLGCEPLNNRTVFDRAVTKRIKARDDRGLSTLRTTMSFIALRRNKAQVHSTIKLVSKTVETINIKMPTGVHKHVHDMLYQTARAVFVKFVALGDDSIVDSYMAFLELIMRVRQSCCHAGLVPLERREIATQMFDQIKKNDKEKVIDPEYAADLLAKLRGELAIEKLEECAVCFEQLEEDTAMILRDCKHIFCQTCLERISNHVCPICREPYGPDDMISKQDAEAAAKKDTNAKEKEVKNAARSAKTAMKMDRSPKCQAILDVIEKMAPDEKGVIFSQWTSFLDIIECELAAEGYTYTRIDGSVSADRRVEAMEDFDTEGCDSMRTPRFMLCSLMAAGVGLNLQRGNVAIMCDPWWNAAAELQAMDRIHRIGQKRPVRVYRLLIENSMETRMIALGETKKALGKGAMEKLSPQEKRKARITTLHELFQVDSVDDLFLE